MTTERSIAARFSTAAATYDRHAAVQQTVAERVFALACRCPAPRRILEVGAGTGILTEKLSGRWPAAEIHAVDISPAMIALARSKLPRARNITWIPADIRQADLAGPYDLIASSSALQWIRPLGETLRRLVALAARPGHLVLALMLDGTFAELHACRSCVAPHKPGPMALPTAPEARVALAGAGLRLEHWEMAILRRRAESAASLLQAIHDQGLTGGAAPAASVPLTRGELNALKSEYERRYANPDGSVPLTYEVLYAAGVVERQ